MNKVEELIEKLRMLQDGKIEYMVTEGSDNDGDIYIECEEVENLIYELLIAPGGRCNWDNITQVRNAGFRVYAGEQDSFGWLTGCVQTGKGIIVYG